MASYEICIKVVFNYIAFTITRVMVRGVRIILTVLISFINLPLCY